MAVDWRAEDKEKNDRRVIGRAPSLEERRNAKRVGETKEGLEI